MKNEQAEAAHKAFEALSLSDWQNSLLQSTSRREALFFCTLFNLKLQLAQEELLGRELI